MGGRGKNGAMRGDLQGLVRIELILCPTSPACKFRTLLVVVRTLPYSIFHYTFVFGSTSDFSVKFNTRSEMKGGGSVGEPFASPLISVQMTMMIPGHR